MVDRRAAQAGLLYCAALFAAGFVLGAIRTLWVSPLTGELIGLALEAPVLLAISWTLWGWIAETLEVSERFLERLVMGGVALAVLVAAEAVIALAADRTAGRAVSDYFRNSGESGLLLGLLAQLAFAFFPMLRRRQSGG